MSYCLIILDAGHATKDDQLLFILGSESLEAAVLEAAMPTMVMVIALADRFGLDARLAGLIMGWSTLAGLVTLPLWLGLLKGIAS